MILDCLGSGGMGTVYAAYDPELDRKIAIKQLRVDLRDKPGVGVSETRLFREARAMAQLTHPNVITVHDVGEHDGAVFLAMEFVEGQNLKDWAEEEHDWREVLDVYGAAARGLEAAHTAGLVHRDFKPENVMIGEDARVRVMDFGLARAGEGWDELRAEATPDTGQDGIDLLGTPVTRVGDVLGTPAYMSPEQHLGLEVDARTDQFSFCVALYEALYRQRPFEAETLYNLVARVTEGTIVPPPSETKIPAQVYRALRRGLLPDPADRWPSMAALLQALHVPATRSWRWTWPAGAGLIAITAGIAFSLDREPQDLCGTGDERMDALWGEEAKTAVQAAITRHGTPFAQDVWTSVERELDAYAEQWRAQWRDACQATHVRHEQSEALLDRRMACLERRRRSLEGFLEALAGADDAIAERAAQAVTKLDAPARCGDPEFLEAQRGEPSPGEMARQVEALRAELDHVAGLRAGGKRTGFHETSSQLLESARLIGYAPLVAEAEALVGKSLADQAEFEDAQRHYEAAYFLARAQGEDELAAALSTDMVYFFGFQRSDFAAALEWAKHADADITKAGSDPVRRSQLLTHVGGTHDLAGDFGLAVEKLEEALALIEDTHGSRHLARASTLTRLGDALESQARYAEAAEAYQTALPLIGDHLGEQHPAYGVALNNLGNTLAHEARFEDSLRYIEQSHAIWDANYGPDHPNMAASLNAMGQSLMGLGRHAEALELHQRSLVLREKRLGKDHPRCAWSHEHVAASLRELGRHEEALEHARRALELLEKAHGTENHMVAYALVEVGLAEHNTGMHAEAVETLERALRLREGSDADISTVATVKWALARALWPDGDPARALELAREARTIYAADAKLWQPTVAQIDDWLREQGPSAGSPG